MKRMFLATAVAVVAAAVVQAQATMTGTWQGESPGGSKVVLNATATPTVLTGTLTVDGQKLAIADGKMARNTFTFTVALPPNNAIQAFSGEFTQDEVKLWMDRRGPASAAVLTRVK
jgi:hypothetical protein